jgi:hypothetical protein
MEWVATPALISLHFNSTSHKHIHPIYRGHVVPKQLLWRNVWLRKLPWSMSVIGSELTALWGLCLELQPPEVIPITSTARGTNLHKVQGKSSLLSSEKNKLCFF